ncbi:TetR family transcriptional regulator [Krasilnikovia cinnamomea]|uniref:TetR family transcriptional regulator n=1 Tax=Krasilnikovia cinnamomea TaxID=349313 RepID=A0A4Q7ZKS7_9ACTN|nr:TetR/AcrR family transcriptional regulator [Krasilnikovia cinnamomea]RZU51174.1 TetR family transcriptional regulator [Krasilnikovia cinnamomea]
MASRGDATRDRLLDATIQLVRDVGYAQTTTRAIAQAAGVAEGTLYRHYPDKAGLFAAAVGRQSAPVTAWARDLPARAGAGTVAGNLTDCLTRLATLRTDIVPFELAMLTDPDLGRAAAAARTAEPGPPEFLTQYLQAEQHLGRIRADLDPAKIAVVLLATLFGLAVPSQRTTDALGGSWPDITDAVHILIDGIGTPARPDDTARPAADHR